MEEVKLLFLTKKGFLKSIFQKKMHFFDENPWTSGFSYWCCRFWGVGINETGWKCKKHVFIRFMTCIFSHTLHYFTSCDVYCMLLYGTIDVLTIVHPGNVIRWVWSWIKCMSSIDAGMCKYDWWYDDTCAAMITCSSCIDLLFTHMTGENGPAGWILYLVMLCVHVLRLIWILLLCIFFQYFHQQVPSAAAVSEKEYLTS